MEMNHIICAKKNVVRKPMIINCSDKVVNIKIPKTIEKLKQEIIDELYDDVEEIEIQDFTKYDSAKQDILHQNDLITREVKTIGIWMSGGADSSLLAYLLAKKIKDEELNIKLQPLSVRRGRPNNPIYAGNVVDFIESDLDVKLNDHLVYYPSQFTLKNYEKEYFWFKDTVHFSKDIIQVLYSGITCNPPVDDDSIPKNKERDRDETVKNKPIETKNPLKHFYNPFFNINKKDLKTIYDRFNLTDKLFPLTFSCEGEAEVTKTHTQHCEKCWWCQERFWAFGRYV